MSDREKIISRLSKMKALADGGVGGERENAARLLEEVAAKYGIELDDIVPDEETLHPIDIPRGWKLDRVNQLLALMRLEKYGSTKVLDHCCIVYHHKLRKGRFHVASRSVKCTDTQFVELMSKFTVLSRDFDRQRKALFRAFIDANDLLLPYAPELAPQTDEERDLCEEARRLALGIQKSALAKQLPPPMLEGTP
ncbi:MAG: hypothetical protein IJS32_02545 [Kiritimatiellae bacterium]|nr:hypothetical protein [Kiritimatiellia bacterium]